MMPVKEGLWKGKITLEFIHSTDKSILRFLSIAAAKGIVLQEVKISESGTGTAPIRFQVYLTDFYQLRDIKRKAGVSYRIIKKSGAPFYFRFLTRHKGIPVGITAFCMLLFLLSRFLWSISFDGNSLHTDEEIRMFLWENNIATGIPLKEVPCEDIETMLRNRFFDITWVSAELNGTRLTIHIKENYDKEIAETEEKPYSLIAGKDAVITDIVTRSGTPMVEKGMAVKQGDVLVSGIVQTLNENDEPLFSDFVKADADIFGQTTYTYEDTIPVNYEKKFYTGKKRKAFSIQISGKNYALFLKNPSYELYDKEESIKQVELWDNFFLPVYTGTTTYREYEFEKSSRTKDELRAMAEARYLEFLAGLEEKGVEIIEKNGTIQFDATWCSVHADIVAIEKLGKVLPLTEEEMSAEQQKETTTEQ